MSYYSQLQLSWDDSDCSKGNVTGEMLADLALRFARENNWSEEVSSDLKVACESDHLSNLGFNKAHAFGIIDLLAYISSNLPDVTFYAKGSGEEFFDIWVRVFRGGIATAQHGPFEPDPESMPTGNDVVLLDEELRNDLKLSQKQPIRKPWWKRMMGT